MLECRVGTTAPNGVGIPRYVRYRTNYQDAFWDDSASGWMQRIDVPSAGVADVVGHEMSHGVESRNQTIR